MRAAPGARSIARAADPCKRARTSAAWRPASASVDVRNTVDRLLPNWMMEMSSSETAGTSAPMPARPPSTTFASLADTMVFRRRHSSAFTSITSAKLRSLCSCATRDASVRAAALRAAAFAVTRSSKSGDSAAMPRRQCIPARGADRDCRKWLLPIGPIHLLWTRRAHRASPRLGGIDDVHFDRVGGHGVCGATARLRQRDHPRHRTPTNMLRSS